MAVRGPLGLIAPGDPRRLAHLIRRESRHGDTNADNKEPPPSTNSHEERSEQGENYPYNEIDRILEGIHRLQSAQRDL
jgi:hypothetical protein